MEKIFLMGLCLVITACATSTATRNAPGLALDTLKVASGQPLGSSNSDHKPQISVVSHINQDMTCQSLKSHLLAEIIGPLPSNRIVATGSFDKFGKSTIVAQAPSGKYSINLVNSRGSRKITSLEFESTTDRDRFDLYFQACE